VVLLLARDTAEVPARALVARLDHLVARGWDAQLVCDEEPALWRKLVPEGRAASVWFADRRDGTARWAGSPGTRLRARAIRRAGGLGGTAALALAAHRPDVVHLPTAATALAASSPLMRLPGRVVVTLGADDLRVAGHGAPSFHEPVWAVADAVHVPDERLAAEARARGCPDDLPIEFIPPAAGPPGPGAPLPRGGGSTVRLITAAPLTWTQGHEHALRAVRLLLDRGIDCEYRLLGAGPYAEAVAFARYQLGLEDRVELLPPPSAAGLRDQLAWADAYVHAAVVAGPSAGLIDARSAGLPAVVSDAGGAAPAADDGILVAPRRDPERMADQLAALAGAGLHAPRRNAADAGAAGLTPALDAFERLYRSLVDN
jgi:glycosyltransferase involved in cell wall biosynthesis